jgi:hypothetical protein
MSFSRILDAGQGLGVGNTFFEQGLGGAHLKFHDALGVLDGQLGEAHGGFKVLLLDRSVELLFLLVRHICSSWCL